jgi:hypothetical protein
MSLMDRIKIKSFLSLSYFEQEELISRLQTTRVLDQSEARAIAAKGNTKSARRNKKKAGKRIIDPKKEALKALQKLTPAQLQQLIAKVS